LTKRFSIFQKSLIFGILILLIGMCIVSSTGKNIESTIDNHFELENNPKELQTCGHFVYFGGFTDDPWKCSLYKGSLDDIQNSTCICQGGVSGNFLSGYTWTNDAKLLACEYGNGLIYGIDYESCDMWSIGGGGDGLNSIAYDPTSEIIYGCSNDALYKINASTGEQTYIGNLGNGPSYMIGLSFDEDGELYGWDVGTDRLWTIDKETGDVFLVGPLGIDINYAQDGDFCKVDDILYIAAFLNSPQYGSYLFECDKNTGECTIISQFPDSSQDITCFVVPWNFRPYIPSNYTPCGEAVDVPFNLSWDGGDPYSGDTVTYDIYLDTKEPPQLFTTVGPYPANQIHIEIGPIILPCFDYYYWKIVACDNYGACAEGPKCVFNTYCPSRPTDPEIDGPSRGGPGIDYEFTFVSTNPLNFSIKYLVEWGDGNISETGFFESGEIVTLNHSWYEKETFLIKAKAIDEYAKESNWSEFKISIPRNNEIFRQFLLHIFKRLPPLELIIKFVGVVII